MSKPPDLDALVRESDWQRVVVQALRANGWRVFVDRMAFRSDAGWPDVFAVHPGWSRLLWLECKTQRGRVSAAQEAWIGDLRRAGCAAYVVRPSDWHWLERAIREPDWKEEAA